MRFQYKRTDKHTELVIAVLSCGKTGEEDDLAESQNPENIFFQLIDTPTPGTHGQRNQRCNYSIQLLVTL